MQSKLAIQVPFCVGVPSGPSWNVPPGPQFGEEVAGHLEGAFDAARDFAGERVLFDARHLEARRGALGTPSARSVSPSWAKAASRIASARPALLSSLATVKSQAR